MFISSVRIVTVLWIYMDGDSWKDYSLIKLMGELWTSRLLEEKKKKIFFFFFLWGKINQSCDMMKATPKRIGTSNPTIF